MKITTQLVTLALSLLLVSAHDDHGCENLYKNLTAKCASSMVTIRNCYELKIFSSGYTPSGVYKLRKGSFDNTVNMYCDMDTDGGGWTIIQRHKKNGLENFNRNQGRIQDFLKGGSESGVDIEGGANPSIVSLKQGVWEAQPPRSYGVFNFG